MLFRSERFPWSWFSSTQYQYGYNLWAAWVYPYVKNFAVYGCPSNIGGNPPGTPPSWQQDRTSGLWFIVAPNYRMSAYFGSQGWGPGVGSNCAGVFPPPPVSAITQPGHTVMLFDGLWWDTGNQRDVHPPYSTTPACGLTRMTAGTDPLDQNSYNPYWYRPWIGQWHAAGVNIAFADGHVKIMPKLEIFTDSTDSLWKLNQ